MSEQKGDPQSPEQTTSDEEVHTTSRDEVRRKEFQNYVKQIQEQENLSKEEKLQKILEPHNRLCERLLQERADRLADPSLPPLKRYKYRTHPYSLAQLMASSPDSLLKSLIYENDDGEQFDYESCAVLEAERRAIYAALDADVFAETKNIYSVTTKSKTDGTAKKEFLVAVEGEDKTEFLLKSCTVSCEDVPYSGMVEYRFEEPCTQWCLSPVTQDSLQG